MTELAAPSAGESHRRAAWLTKGELKVKRVDLGVRGVLLEVGQRLTEAGVLARSDDALQLTLVEVRETALELPGIDRWRTVAGRRAQVAFSVRSGLSSSIVVYSHLMATERLLTLAEVAEHLRLNVETVRRYVRSGKLRATRLGGGRAGYRVPEDEMAKLTPASSHLARQNLVVRYGGEWPDDAEERAARLAEMRRRIDSIPGNRNLPSIAVKVIREMREENG